MPATETHVPAPDHANKAFAAEHARKAALKNAHKPKARGAQ